MNKSLLLAESSSKLLKLSGYVRTYARDHHWTCHTLAGVRKVVKKFDRQHCPVYQVQNRRQLNRIISAAVESDDIWIATDDDDRGELLAADLAGEIVAQYPEKLIKRLRLRSLSFEAVVRAWNGEHDFDQHRIRSVQSRRLIDAAVYHGVRKQTGRHGGRALLPCLNLIRCGQHDPTVTIVSDGLRFRTGPTTPDVLDDAIHNVGDRITDIHVDVETVTVPTPPPLTTIADLLTCAVDALHVRSYVASVHVAQLYHEGLITGYPVPGRIENFELYHKRATNLITNLITTQSDVLTQTPRIDPTTACIVPTDIEVLPSDVPKPVRQVYRLIWARTLQAWMTPMVAKRETARFNINGVGFSAVSYVPIEPGHDAASFGMFYPRGHIECTRPIDRIYRHDGGVGETDAIKMFSEVGIQQPAGVIKGLENAGYVDYYLNELNMTTAGHACLGDTANLFPQLLDPTLLTATERQFRAAARGEIETDGWATGWVDWMMTKPK